MFSNLAIVLHIILTVLMFVTTAKVNVLKIKNNKKLSEKYNDANAI